MKNKQVTVNQFLNCLNDLNSIKPLLVSIDTNKGYSIVYKVSNIDHINGYVVLSNEKNYYKDNMNINDILSHISNYNKNDKIKLEVHTVENSINKDVFISRLLLDNAIITTEKYHILIKI